MMHLKVIKMQLNELMMHLKVFKMHLYLDQ